MIVARSRKFALAIVVFLLAGIVLRRVFPAQTGDPSFDARVAEPTYLRNGPVVFVDEGHYNVHTATGRYKPFADLLANDGYIIRAHKGRFTEKSLEAGNILVIANALGIGGAAQQIANVLGMEGQFNVSGSAFADDEIAAVDRWVQAGGSLLLVSDHAPAGEAARKLSETFGVAMSGGYAEDPSNADPETGSPGFIVFSRENGLIGNHPIMRGIERVLSFTGQSLIPSPDAVVLLKLGPKARELSTRSSRQDGARNVAGQAQAVALEPGKGRIVVVGEAAMLTSQVARAGNRTMSFGMARPGYDDRQFCLNIMHWLSRK